ncbi:MAG: acyl carrier protein, partial [Candidatus Hydrogenedentales bacterium]
HVRALIADALGVATTDVPDHEPFDRLGLASRDAVTLSGDLQDWLGRELPHTILYEYPTPAALAEFLAGEVGAPEQTHMREKVSLAADQDRACAPMLALDAFEEGRI